MPKNWAILLGEHVLADLNGQVWLDSGGRRNLEVRKVLLLSVAK